LGPLTNFGARYGKRDWGFLMIQQGGATLKLEYINKEEGEAARNIFAKGESVHKVQTEKLIYAISNAMTQAYMLGYETSETEMLSK
jgi:hypothetical protein